MCGRVCACVGSVGGRRGREATGGGELQHLKFESVSFGMVSSAGGTVPVKLLL